jgi:hypothetical protein
MALVALLLFPLIGVETINLYSGARSQETFGLLPLIQGADEIRTPEERVWQVNVAAAVIFIGAVAGLLVRPAALRLAAGIVGLLASLALLLPAFFKGSFFVPFLASGGYLLMAGFALVSLDGLVGLVRAAPKGFFEFRLK